MAQERSRRAGRVKQKAATGSAAYARGASVIALSSHDPVSPATRTAEVVGEQVESVGVRRVVALSPHPARTAAGCQISRLKTVFALNLEILKAPRAGGARRVHARRSASVRWEIPRPVVVGGAQTRGSESAKTGMSARSNQTNPPPRRGNRVGRAGRGIFGGTRASRGTKRTQRPELNGRARRGQPGRSSSGLRRSRLTRAPDDALAGAITAPNRPASRLKSARFTVPS